LEIIIAKNAGFCFGVDRAVKMTLEELDNDGQRVYSYGPLIHNPQAVAELEEKGFTTLESFEDLEVGRLVFRSHGVPEEIQDKAEQMGLSVIDCTCPYVKAVHKRVRSYSEKGYDIVIIGDPEHPEVVGINGWCNDKAFIINSEEEARKLPKLEKVCVVSQTTNRFEKFQLLSDIVKGKSEKSEVFNTICTATRARQDSAAELAI